MKKIFSAEGLDEATARLIVAQEQEHGRHVEAHQVAGRWCVSVYLYLCEIPTVSRSCACLKIIGKKP